VDRGFERRSRQGTAAVFALLTAAVCLLAVPAAHAALGFQGLSAKPANLAAGAHSNVDIHVGFTNPSDQVKDLTVHLPPGLVGNPRAAPLCTATQLNADNCPAGSQVGSVVANVNVVAGVLEVPLTVNGSLYNLVAHQGEPARFGIVLKPVALPPPIGGALPKIIQQSAVKLRRSDFGLDTIVNDFPRTTNGLETDITSLDLSLKGTVNGKGFMRNPTSCTPKTFSFDAVSYGSHSVHGTAPSFTPTNCAALSFSPTLTPVVGAGPRRRFPSLTTTIKQDPGEAGLSAAKVLLPEGIGPNLDALNHTCTLARFRADASACPNQSIVGSATAASPFVPTALRGPVVLVEPGPNDLFPRLGVDLQGPLSLQVLGSFVAENAGLGNAFNHLPDIPISSFALRFDGGKGGLLLTSINLCQAAPQRFLGSFDGFNGAHRQSRFTAQINGCS
jgi:hypothetical protein